MVASDGDEFALLSALATTPTGSYASWAAELGWSASAVRRRTLELRGKGVFEGFVALPAANAFGFQELGMAFYRKQPVPTADVFAIPGVMTEAILHDDCQFIVAFGSPKDLAETRAALSRLMGVEPGREVRPAPRPLVDPANLGPLEWRVMRAFVDDPRAPLAGLAKATGLTPRTVAAKRDEMLRTRTVDVWPLLRSGRSEGAIYFHVNVWADTPRNLSQALEGIARHTVISTGATPPMAYVFCQATDFIDQQRIVRALESSSGVEHVGLILTLAYHVAEDNVRGLIDNQIARWRVAKTATRD